MVGKEEHKPRNMRGERKTQPTKGEREGVNGKFTNLAFYSEAHEPLLKPNLIFLLTFHNRPTLTTKAQSNFSTQQSKNIKLTLHHGFFVVGYYDF